MSYIVAFRIFLQEQYYIAYFLEYLVCVVDVSAVVTDEVAAVKAVKLHPIHVASRKSWTGLLSVSGICSAPPTRSSSRLTLQYNVGFAELSVHIGITRGRVSNTDGSIT